MLAGSASPVHKRKKNNHYGLHAGSTSPFRQRKVDHFSGMRTISVSPVCQRNVENRHGIQANSISPLNKKNMGNRYGMRRSSISPLNERIVDDHYGQHARSISPMNQRNTDKHFVIHAGNISPLSLRNMDNHYGKHAHSISPLRRRNVNNRYGMHPGSISPLSRRNGVNHYKTHVGSISPFNRRNVDNHYGMHSSSISPSRQRNMDDHYRVQEGSISPLHQRKVDHHYDSGFESFDHPGGPRRGRGRGFRGGRGPGRFRDASPPFGRGRGRKSFERSFDRPGFEPFPLRGEGIRSNPNVSPRDGDWLCPEPLCGNLNFARRASCNSCDRLRSPGSGPGGSPCGRYMGPQSPHGPWQCFPGPPVDRGPIRDIDEFGSPPRDWSRDEPRALGMGPPPPRHGRMFTDHIRRERPNYPEDFRERSKLDRVIPPEWGHRDHGGGELFHERRGGDGWSERRSPPPPLPAPYRDHWMHDGRDKSRSPVKIDRKDLYRGPYMGRGRDDRRGLVRKRIGGRY